MSIIHPVILSGGSGTRLWPLSRAMYPKQFIRFFDGKGPSFLGATLATPHADGGFAAPTLICNNDHRFLVKDELERAGIALEPNHPGAGRPQHGAGHRRCRAGSSARRTRAASSP